MNKSESIKNLALALITFHVKVDKIKKDATNPFFNKAYASLSNILEVINDPLNESGLSFVQFPTGEHGLTTVLMHAESGEYIESDYLMTPVKNDPQAKGSAITYQRRYALTAILGLNIDTDDDANLATHGNTAPNKAAMPVNVKGTADTGNTNGTAKNELPWLNSDTKEFNGAVEKMKAGKSSIEALRKYFRISKATESKLNEQLAGVPIAKDKEDVPF